MNAVITIGVDLAKNVFQPGFPIYIAIFVTF